MSLDYSKPVSVVTEDKYFINKIADFVVED
jgi:hypothetical protein